MLQRNDQDTGDSRQVPTTRSNQESPHHYLLLHPPHSFDTPQSGDEKFVSISRALQTQLHMLMEVPQISFDSSTWSKPWTSGFLLGYELVRSASWPELPSTVSPTLARNVSWGRVDDKGNSHVSSAGISKKVVTLSLTMAWIDGYVNGLSQSTSRETPSVSYTPFAVLLPLLAVLLPSHQRTYFSHFLS